MQLFSTLVLSSALATMALADPSLSKSDAYCPPCVGLDISQLETATQAFTYATAGVKYTDPVTSSDGCCPIGYSFQGCVKDPPIPTTTNPSCPGDNGKFYFSGTKKYKVFCDYTTGQADIIAAVSSPNPKACVDDCATKANCKSSTWYLNQCWEASTQLTAPAFPLAGSVVLLLQ